MKNAKRLDDARQRHRHRRTLHRGDLVEASDGKHLVFVGQSRKPKLDDIHVGAGGKDGIGLEAFGGEIVARRGKQPVGLPAVALRRIHRHEIGNAEPRRVEVDKGAVLVEQYSFDLGQAAYSDPRNRWMCPTSPAVEASRFAAFSLPSTTGSSPVASSLPSSTPHWSKELMLKSVPSTKTRCS